MADMFVEHRVRDGRVTLFIKAGCPYCRNAMEILQNYNFAPQGLQVFDITGLEDVQDYLQQRTRRSTVPHVFFGRQCIGGLSELQNMGCRLPRILQQIGALE